MVNVDRLTMADVDFFLEKRELEALFVAFADMQGRLVGRQVSTEYFHGEVLPSGLRVPAFLLTTDAHQRTADGFALTSAGTGFGDMVVRVDTSTLFRMPWQPAVVGVLGSLELPDGTPVAVAPRAILRRQAQRVEAASLTAALGAEPQFTLVDEQPAGALLRSIRQALTQVPIGLEALVDLTTPGHVEVTLRPDDMVSTCDHVAILRSAVHALAADVGRTATFMPAYSPDKGSSCHLSISLKGLRGGMTLADRSGEAGLSSIGRTFVAGLLAHAAELCLLYAPTVNSYRRFASDALSPTAVNWGPDNRTCAVRVLGSDATLRVENRLPGSDANPYLAAAAMIAAGLDGINRQLPLGDPVRGDGRLAGSPPLPGSLDEALRAWEESAWIAETFGADVQGHYAQLARVELAAARSDGKDSSEGGQRPVAEGTGSLAWERDRYLAAS